MTVPELTRILLDRTNQARSEQITRPDPTRKISVRVNQVTRPVRSPTDTSEPYHDENVNMRTIRHLILTHLL